MSKQSNQRYRKELGLNHKERAKNSNANNSVKTWPAGKDTVTETHTDFLIKTRKMTGNFMNYRSLFQGIFSIYIG